ncbi:hypothetical protein ACJX0J_008185, partial [Zea mays]
MSFGLTNAPAYFMYLMNSTQGAQIPDIIMARTTTYKYTMKKEITAAVWKKIMNMKTTDKLAPIYGEVVYKILLERIGSDLFLYKKIEVQFLTGSFSYRLPVINNLGGINHYGKNMYWKNDSEILSARIFVVIKRDS